ncbi:hypothetical protein FNU79_14460 [Deinococcus detaillensis]|uniref:Uncharacterized protein n=1 Tax=Deinococcus detaillensis TaxID=2592048 RepID=A0A553UNI0_9DEIO|nr:hypothetical protein [Deinococcus detaillensis]TSA81773.1 hypothetical protein FNU79_14460 [Deinococcus detaillensis]
MTQSFTNASPAWINDLSPTQLALARVIQQNGLEARRLDLAGFAWEKGGERLVTISQQVSLSVAFDLAVQQLPCAYTQPADGTATRREDSS